MDIAPTVKRQTNRGTIILDTSMLFLLANKIPAEFLDPSAISPPEMYLDLLPFLAKNGFRVVIPEIVAVQGANMLADGTNLGHHFDTPKKQFDEALKQGFLKAVARGEFENITIVSNTGPQEVDAYCAALHAAATPTPKALGRKSYRHGTLKEMSQTDILRAIKRVHREHDRKELNERAIMSLLERPEYAESELYNFVLTSSQRIEAALFNQPANIRSVVGPGFFRAITGAGLAEHIGLNSDISAEALFEDAFASIQKSLVQTAPQHDAARHPHPDRHHKKNAPFAERSMFERCLTGLKKDLDHWTQARVQREVDAPPPPPQAPAAGAARFAGRFGGLRIGVGNRRNATGNPSNIGRQ